MSRRILVSSRMLSVGLLALVLGCGGGGGGDGGQPACGSEWNTQVVLSFDGPAGCAPAGTDLVCCARLWGVGHDWFLLEIDIPSPGCSEDTTLYFEGYTSSGGSMSAVDQVEYRACLLDALAPGSTALHLENVSGEILSDTFTLHGDWQIYPGGCGTTFQVDGSLP